MGRRGMGLKFGQAFANQIRRRLPEAGYKWYLDKIALNIAGHIARVSTNGRAKRRMALYLRIISPFPGDFISELRKHLGGKST
jgi:hypothetical protein